MSSYSSNLRLTLQTHGENPDTWGDIANNGVFELIEDALTGAITLSPIDTTLTLTNGADSTNEARKAFIKMAGNGGGNTYVVTVPALNKPYIIHNAMTDPDDILTISSTGGTDVSIAIDVMTIVWVGADGNVRQINPSSSNEFTDILVSNTAIIGSPSVPADPLPAGYINCEGLLVNGLPMLPPGMTVPFAGDTPPAGWLLCDGSAYSTTTYAALFAAIGTYYNYTSPGVGNFRVPDLRGYFVRGYHSGSAIDPDFGTRTFGSVQAAAVGPHRHRNGVGDDSGTSDRVFIYGHTDTDTPGVAGGNIDKSSADPEQQGYTSGPVNSGSDANLTETESRPVNVAMNYLIRY